jgi:hypothetical protein
MVEMFADTSCLLIFSSFFCSVSSGSEDNLLSTSLAIFLYSSPADLSVNVIAAMLLREIFSFKAISIYLRERTNVLPEPTFAVKEMWFL